MFHASLFADVATPSESCISPQKFSFIPTFLVFCPSIPVCFCVVKMLVNGEHSASSMPSSQVPPSQASESLSVPLNPSLAEGPQQLGLDYNHLEIGPPLDVAPLRWMPPSEAQYLYKPEQTKSKGRSRTKSVVDAVRQCPLMPLGWLEEEVHRTAGNQTGKIEKFYIDPSTGKKFRSLSSARKYMDTKFGPRDWSVYDSGRTRQYRKGSGKKRDQEANAPLTINYPVDGEASPPPAPADAAWPAGSISDQDPKGKASLVG